VFQLKKRYCHISWQDSAGRWSIRVAAKIQWQGLSICNLQSLPHYLSEYPVAAALAVVLHCIPCPSIRPTLQACLCVHETRRSLSRQPVSYSSGARQLPVLSRQNSETHPLVNQSTDGASLSTQLLTVRNALTYLNVPSIGIQQTISLYMVYDVVILLFLPCISIVCLGSKGMISG